MFQHLNLLHQVINCLAILISCTLANHLGLVNAIEKVIKFKLKIINCVRCFTFWTSLLYLICTSTRIFIASAIAFTLSYLAMWLELLYGYIDTKYNEYYYKIYPTEDTTGPEEESIKDNSNSSVSYM